MATEDELREYLRRATAELRETRRLLRAAREREPIAVIGMGCRFPGGAHGPDALWDLVAEGRDAVGPAPADRGWDVAGLPPVRGGFLADAAVFDAAFFGISPREAVAMDPQQRLLLEVAWEAVEHAGLAMPALKGSPTGVFAGVAAQGYGPRLDEAGPGTSGHVLTGTTTSVASGRIAYTFGFEGPAVTVDTACSSSLVALHWAAASLRRRECALALAGGAAVMANPGMFTEFARQGGLSPDGRCKSFGAGADGTGWAEGVGLVVLERLSDALRHGHRVLALVRGSAVNSDGASNGLTAPNGLAQQRVIRAALADAGLSAGDVDVVEGHGTGTVLGDPVEAAALQATYGQGRDRPLWLGSLKSNLGHAQAAAGIGGVIKLVQALRHGVVPRTLHAAERSPHVDWDAGAVTLATEAVPWPGAGRPRRAAVSSFGISGTNAHVVLEQAPEPDAPPARAAGPVPWVLSAKTPTAVRVHARRVLAAVEARPEVSAADVGAALARRAPLPHRVVLLGADRDRLLRDLRAVAEGGIAPSEAAPGDLAFVFPGQGAERAGMGQVLHRAFPVFARAFDEARAALGGSERYRHVAGGGTDAVQAGLFAVEVALARLLESWGVRPGFLIGHSVGELAAAHVAGVLSLADAAALVAARGRLMAALPAGGGMLAVAAAEHEVRGLSGDLGLDLAAVNGPTSVVLSGPLDDLAEAEAALAARGARTKRLPVAHAFHSRLVEPVLAEFAEVAAALTYAEPAVPLVSAVTGELDEDFGAAYWVRQVREPVRFADAVATAHRAGATRFAEVGPGAVLTPLVVDAVGGHVAAVALGRADDEDAALLRGVGELFASGAAVDWPRVVPAGAPVELPTYPFERVRHWLPAPRRADPVAAGLTGAGHAVLRAATGLPGGGRLLAGRLDVAEQPWLADHVVGGETVVPGAAVVDLVAHAAGAGPIGELTLHAPLVLPESGAAVQVVLSGPGEDGARSVVVRSRGDDGWTEHATGTVLAGPAEPTGGTPWPEDAEPVDTGHVYDRLAGLGFAHGPAFRALTAVRRRDGEVFAEVALPDVGPVAVHPVLLDAMAQAAALAGLGDGPLLPFSFSDVRWAGGSPGSARIRVTRRAGDAVSLRAEDAAGRPLLEVGSLVLRPPVATSLSRVRWTPVAPAEAHPVRWADRLPDTGAAPDWVVHRVPPGEPEAVTTGVVEVLRGWLADERTGHAKLVVVTDGTPSSAAVRGLVRSAQAEHPGRFALLDPGDAEVADVLPALAASGAPEAAVREGRLAVPGLVRAAPGPAAVLRGPVLITGGTGGLGALVARHLVHRHGVRDLLLLSRRGPAAATALVAELTAAGARAEALACDVGDRDALAAALRGREVRSVVHAAGAAGDDLLEALTPRRVREVFAAKALGALHLHELLPDVEAFVLFSSAASVLGAPGQGAYAAANAFLDGLAEHRHALRLPALSLCWGPWEVGMTTALGAADRRRFARAGMLPFTAATGLAAFDGALGLPDPVVVPVRGTPRLPGPAPTAPPTGRTGPDAALALVREHAAAVLGHASAVAIGPDAAFADLGFDSLTGVELRNRLVAATGVRLPSTLVFDHPTPRALADRLTAGAAPAAPVPAAPVPAAPASDGPAPAAPVHAAPVPDVPAPAAPGVPAPDARAACAAEEDPVVIVGMGCRYPGGVTGPEALWDFVAEGRDAIGPPPADRGWPADHARAGGFLADAALFDAAFFGIGAHEALAMDPQQRLVLETAWETLENAGIPPRALRGSATGVFLGVMYHDYAPRLAAVPGLDGLVATGTAGSVASGRVAYALGFEGPAVTLDTACSSSLVALHWAVRSVRSGECSLALAGGVTVMATPGTFTEFARQGGLAADGRCKSFGAGADGTGWAEGVGLVLVERLSDARRLGHEVLAVVRGSAVNSDGASNGLTAPSGPAQQRVIREALADAGLSARDVDVVEGHGTGTALGDPIEIGALMETYGRDRPGEPLWLGSVKSNLGHTQAAAGVAGVIKAVQAMRHGLLPKTLHAAARSTGVDWDRGAVDVLREARPWPDTGRPRRAGVSSFGIGGTNAHVVLEQAPAPAATAPPPLAPPPFAWPVSGPDAGALRAQAGLLLDHLDARPGLAPADVGFTLATARTHWGSRAVVLGRDRGALLDGLAAVAEGEAAANVVSGTAGEGRIAFLFAGQGAQRARMGRGLAARFGVFADALAEVASTFELDRPLTAVLDDAEALADTRYAQPALFAVEVAMVRLLASWGVLPDVVLGHSLGELTAAHVAGVLSLPDACALVAARGALMAAAPGPGAMLAVRAGEAEVRGWLTPDVDLAAVNGPASVVVSGPRPGVEALADRLREGGVRTRWLRVAHAFHSRMMAPVLDGLAAEARKAVHREPLLPVVSAVAGAGELGPEHWARQVREPVRFADAVDAARAAGVTRFVEVGPDATLSALAAASAGADALLVPLCRPDRDEADSAFAALARLHAAGVDVDWAGACGGGGRVALPTYAFRRRRFWPDDPVPGRPDDSGGRATRDGARVQEPPDRRDPRWADVVRAQLAEALGHGDAAAVDMDRDFTELGFDSLAAVEFRNRIATITGLELSAGVVFDHPTPAALARYLAGALA
ncbi:acyl transferase domain-containing protein [Saccharothrix australiensis]|uniref:Acyl transferase domain-containing protein n=1 Tax=Saccharothrix australiensis TaxID=2072 RepID=A0A495W1U7_9PSEU|nr:type I polyketide synthase [Saccharothrix australiensis]RKT55632.1 acyl transferase domain-containing protein [Saccharothrix australiensis]